MILQRYIMREILLSFLLAFATVMAVCIVGTTFQVFRMGFGLQLTAKTVPLLAGNVAPWALLVASCTTPTLVYGRLAADNEIDAMRMSGIHLNRILLPAIVFGVLLAGASWWINESVAPASHYARRQLIRDSTLLVLKLPPPGNQTFKIGAYDLSYVDYRDGKMERPRLTQRDMQGGQTVFQAVSGYAVVEEGKIPRIVFNRPETHLFDPTGKGTTIMTADKDVSIDLKLDDLYHGEMRPEDLTLRDLWKSYGRELDPRKKTSLLLTIHTRYARSLAPLCLVLVAMPIGVLVKRGSRLAGLGAALPPMFLYFVAFFVFQGIAEKGKVPPIAAAWAPDALLAVLAACLLGGVYRK